MTSPHGQPTGAQDPALSIGMPVFNGDAFVGEAIASLLAQTRGDFELIISDNASTDQTPNIISAFAAKDRRIRYVRQKTNIGAEANFRFVLDQARCDSFMWAAADDFWDTHWVERLLPLVLEKPCLAYGRLKTVDATGQRVLHPADNRDFDFSGKRLWRRLKFFLMPGLLGKANPIYGIFHRSLITKDLWKIFVSDRRGADVLALYELLKSYEIHAAGSVYLMKRKHDNSAAALEGSEKTQKPLRARMFRKSQLLDFLEFSAPWEKPFVIAAYPIARLKMTGAKIQFLFLKAKNR